MRHAIAIDERRAFFRQNLWGDADGGQDVKQVWFAGCHSDVGGAAGLARIPLEWMLVEARAAGLQVIDDLARAQLDEPDPLAPINESLRGAWKLAEYFPKMAWNPASRQREPRLNKGASRHIREGALLHETVAIRRDDDPRYQPDNLPRDQAVEPWKRFPTG